MSRPGVGLALGSGSARGLAHLGVIRAIEEAGIKVDCIAGTSMGALIGAIHAAGKLDELETTFMTFDWKKIASFFDVVLPKSGLLDGARVSELVRAHIRADSIETLPIPFAAVATDLVSGEEVVIRNGDVIEAVRASLSVPGIFTPVRSNGHVLVDGGLTNPVPVSAARAMGADIVIAVDLNHEIIAGKNLKPLRTPQKAGSVEANPPGLFSRWVGDYRLSMKDIRQKLLAGDNPVSAQFREWVSTEPLPSIFEVLLASINIMETHITETRLRLDRPDVIIQPPLGHIRFLEFDRAEEIIAIGYQHTRRQLAALPLDPA
ncbi:MAG TPA: patatin-like phospholipase family protein [Gallionella sp.]|nr:patatin-like phospholipase family protein [Gallionella sp.]